MLSRVLSRFREPPASVEEGFEARRVRNLQPVHAAVASDHGQSTAIAKDPPA
jgi:hypothetical protein